MKILNICMSAPFTEDYSYQDNLLSEYQRKLGYDVVLLTGLRTRGENGMIVDVEPGRKRLANGVDLIRIKTGGKLKRFFGIYRELDKVLKELAPDMVFIHGLASFVPQSVIRYKKKRNPRLVIVADNHQDEGTTQTRKFPFNVQIWLFRTLWKRWILDVDKVYGTTSWRTTFASKFYGVPSAKLDVLVMGIDSDRLPKDYEKTRKIVREELGVDERSFLFVTGGKIDRNKKTVEALKAFNRLEESDATFLVFGAVAPDVKSEFDALLAKNANIRYVGYVHSQDVQRLFIASDFAVFPGRHSVLWEEAIGCGIPSLFRKYEERDHTDVCGNCVRIKEADPETIYDVMNRVVCDEAYYAEMKRKAREAADAYSYRRIAEKSLECLTSLKNSEGATVK